MPRKLKTKKRDVQAAYRDYCKKPSKRLYLRYLRMVGLYIIEKGGTEAGACYDLSPLEL